MESIFMTINSNTLVQKLTPYIIIVLIAYLLNTIIFSFLPKSGVDFIEQSNTSLGYTKYSGFYSQINSNEKEEVVKIEKKDIQTLSKYNLTAIYSTSSNGGWISLEDKTKSYILSQWEDINGYILTKLYKNYVIFEKSAKEYRLDMKQKNDAISYEVTSNSNSNIKENIIVKDDVVQINRDYLNSYVTDIEKVWNNIAIKEVMNNNKIEGFKVFKVKKDSVFSKLGLKEGDVIKAVNNNVLASYADAFNVYNQINNTKYLNIEILRNNEVMELNYEID
jgi:type II secretion system protein C